MLLLVLTSYVLLCNLESKLDVPEFTIAVIALYQIIQGNDMFCHCWYASKEQTYSTEPVF